MEIRLAPHGLYEVQHMLGQGGIGTVWLATYKRNGRLVALKLGEPFEQLIPEEMVEEETLAYHKQEWAFYRRLRDIRVQLPGLPRAYEYGVMQRVFNGRLLLQPYMSMQLLGPNLADLIQADRLGPPSFFECADRMLTAVESFHRCGFVHRDIKPENFCIGMGRKEQEVFLVDYGFAKAYDPSAAPMEYEQFGGTPDYSSISQLNECTTGSIDDLESLGYTWLCMLRRGHLPWNCNRDLDQTGTSYSTGVLREMVHLRTRAWAAEAIAGRIPAWLMHWQVLAQSYESTQKLDERDYASFRNILAKGRAARVCQAEE